MINRNLLSSFIFSFFIRNAGKTLHWNKTMIKNYVSLVNLSREVLTSHFFASFLKEREGSKDRAIGREPELRGELVRPFFCGVIDIVLLVFCARV